LPGGTQATPGRTPLVSVRRRKFAETKPYNPRLQEAFALRRFLMTDRGMWYTYCDLPKHDSFFYVIDSKTVTAQILSISLVFNNFHL
jgi:hypothetical protein